ncbi:MAG: porin [Boseongicola sp.]|nr:porin [Boseongicola sp.]
MKTILLTSTALVMSAGIAAAEVTVGGDGRMGVKGLDGGDVVFDSRIRISFSASGETDNGLSFGGSIRADNAGDGAKGMAGSVNVSGAFGTVTMGDTGSAAKQAVGQASGVGYTGLGDLNEIGYIGDVHPSVRWDYTMGDLSLHASTDSIGQADDADSLLSGAMSYSIGDVGIGAGVERMGDRQNIVASVSAALGDASVKVAYGSDDDSADDSYGASASFVSGSATFTAFASSKGGMDHFGIGAAFDLGGGAAIKGGFVDGDSLTGGSSFDLGITMGF